MIPNLQFDEDFQALDEAGQNRVRFLLMSQFSDRIGGVAVAREMLDQVEQIQKIGRAFNRANGLIPGGPLEGDEELLAMAE